MDGSEEMTPPWPTGPVAELRRDVAVSSPIRSARLYSTALGGYEFHLNGQKVGDQQMAPGWTDYRQHLVYQVYDLTKSLHLGKNVLVAYLAAGWYSTPLRWYQQGNNYGLTQPALLAQLRIEYMDGRVEFIGTDSTWTATTSPLLHAELYNGETYDARVEQMHADMQGAGKTALHPATIVNPHVPQIEAQDFPPVRIERPLHVQVITNPTPGVYIFDFGQNMAAIPHLRVRGESGDVVQLRFGEILNENGTLYTENLRTAKATDRFILSGHGVEEYQSHFTFHGFRYAEITGLREVPTTDTLEALVIHTDASFTAKLSTENSLVRQIWSNVLWGQRSNFIGLPTDCPQRDERLGWSADAQVFWRTAAYNMDLTTFSRKYAADLRGTQVGTDMYGIYAPGTTSSGPGFGPAWSDVGVIIPWTSWMQTGDQRVIEDNWSAMEKYLKAIEASNPEYLWRHNIGFAFGDWLSPTITTPEDLLATAYWAYDASLMREMAKASGREQDVAKYETLFAKIKNSFIKAFVHSDGSVSALNTYPSFPAPSVNPVEENQSADVARETQTGYVLALHMNLLPGQLRGAAANRLVRLIQKNHGLLGTGFLGTPYLLGVLADTGHSDLAYSILLNTQYPSWGYLVEHGATTTWERWNGDTKRDDPSMNSYNHYAYGAVAEWLYRYAAGIDTSSEGAGFKSIYLHPHFDRRVGAMRLEYESGYGQVMSDWKVDGDLAYWTVVVPPNTTARIATREINGQLVTVNHLQMDKSKDVIRGTDGNYSLQAGSYEIVVALK